VADELSQTQLNHLNATALFEPHCRSIIDEFFPPHWLIDLRQERHTEFHCENPYLFDNLRCLLPFGVTLSRHQHDLLTDRRRTAAFLQGVRRQLLYWYLARAYVGPLREPITQLTLYYEADQFWFNHVLNDRTWIFSRLLSNNPVFFLQRFTLTHSFIELEVGELRLTTNRPELHPFLAEGNTAYTIVHVAGTTYHLDLLNPVWEVTAPFSTSRLVDPPEPYFLPPESPAPDFHARPQQRINYYTELYDHASGREPVIDDRRDSDLDSDITTDTDTTAPNLVPPTQVVTNPVTGWEQTDNRPPHQSQRCWCNKELCNCGNRPNTPPTPPHITLWTPGDKHLPGRS
jgi:hypothetical protein